MLVPDGYVQPVNVAENLTLLTLNTPVRCFYVILNGIISDACCHKQFIKLARTNYWSNLYNLHCVLTNTPFSYGLLFSHDHLSKAHVVNLHTHEIIA